MEFILLIRIVLDQNKTRVKIERANLGNQDNLL